MGSSLCYMETFFCGKDESYHMSSNYSDCHTVTQISAKKEIQESSSESGILRIRWKIQQGVCRLHFSDKKWKNSYQHTE